MNSLIIRCQWKSPRELRTKTVAGVVVTVDSVVSDWLALGLGNVSLFHHSNNNTVPRDLVSSL
jgi:hypothetical protein